MTVGKQDSGLHYDCYWGWSIDSGNSFVLLAYTSRMINTRATKENHLILWTNVACGRIETARNCVLGAVSAVG